MRIIKGIVDGHMYIATHSETLDTYSVMSDTRTILDLDIQCGQKYQHYSGKKYLVIGIAHLKVEGNTTVYVVYQARYYDDKFGLNAYWIRPIDMFKEKITYHGTLVPRFQLIEG